MIPESPEFDAEFGRLSVLYVDLSVSQYLGCVSSHADRLIVGTKMMVRTFGFTMDELLRMFALLAFNIAREMQNDGYFTGF